MTPNADSERVIDDPRPHYAIQVTNMPPTEIVCKCGARWVGGDVITNLKAHMDALNPLPRIGRSEP
jgi:hypothetical protein